MANNRLLSTQIRRHELPGTRKNVYGKVTPSGSQPLVVEKTENSDPEVYLPFLVLQTNMIVILRIQPHSGEKIWYQILQKTSPRIRQYGTQSKTIALPTAGKPHQLFFIGELLNHTIFKSNLLLTNI
ncbi:hypothetical protein Trydic_g10092 [Trypoxylus dichotomus]